MIKTVRERIQELVERSNQSIRECLRALSLQHVSITVIAIHQKPSGRCTHYPHNLRELPPPFDKTQMGSLDHRLTRELLAFDQPVRRHNDLYDRMERVLDEVIPGQWIKLPLIHFLFGFGFLEEDSRQPEIGRLALAPILSLKTEEVDGLSDPEALPFITYLCDVVCLRNAQLLWGMTLDSLSPSEYIDRASRGLVISVLGEHEQMLRVDPVDPLPLFDCINALAESREERIEAHGTLRFISHQTSLSLQLAEGPALNETKLVRKLLDGAHHAGLAVAVSLNPNERIARATGFVERTSDSYCSIQGDGQWRLYHRNQCVMAVRNGSAFFTERPSLQSFQALCGEQFPDWDGMTLDLWALILHLQENQTKGATLIISNRCEAESQRLRERGNRIEPVGLVARDQLLVGLTSIDGAVMVDEFVVCHSFGIILDGEHSPLGNSRRERGSRFNSAQSYLDHRLRNDLDFRGLGVVLSTDGHLNFLVATRSRVSGREGF